MNAISPQVIKDLGVVWEKLTSAGEVGAMVIASSNPLVFSAGADIKAFTQMDESGGKELIDSGHELLRELGRNRISTIAAINSLAFGGGCELAMACDFRIAAESAIFGQPEIKLGIIPGFGGTQRLPRLVGPEKALEMNLIGDSISAGDAEAYGLANRVVPDHELFDTAVAWARKLASQAPVAVEQVKIAAYDPDLDEGIENEKAGFAGAFQSEDAKEGIGAFLGKRSPKWKGRVSGRRRRPGAGPAREPAASGIDVPAALRHPASHRPRHPCLRKLSKRPPSPRRSRGLADDSGGGVGGGSDRRRDFGAVRDSGFPHAGHRPVGERRSDGGRPHQRLPWRHEAFLAVLPAALLRPRREGAESRPLGARGARGERASAKRS